MQFYASNKLSVEDLCTAFCEDLDEIDKFVKRVYIWAGYKISREVLTQI